MTTDDELDALSDPAYEQYFLVSEDKIRLLLDAAGIRPTDRVVEIGAGAGTIARHIPACASLTLIELDDRLIPYLRANAPAGATVIQGDGVELLAELEVDVLLSNLPTEVTEEQLLERLLDLPFRTAVLALGTSSSLALLTPSFVVTEVTTISGRDFRPPQPSVSRLLQLARRSTPAPR